MRPAGAVTVGVITNLVSEAAVSCRALAVIVKMCGWPTWLMPLGVIETLASTNTLVLELLSPDWLSPVLRSEERRVGIVWGMGMSASALAMKVPALLLVTVTVQGLLSLFAMVPQVVLTV